ncbi:hypothetical protein Hanom_Chr07g00644281 [Helianthus anomalus]
MMISHHHCRRPSSCHITYSTSSTTCLLVHGRSLGSLIAASDMLSAIRCGGFKR